MDPAEELVYRMLARGYVVRTTPGRYRPAKEPPESEGEEHAFWVLLVREWLRRRREAGGGERG